MTIVSRPLRELAGTPSPRVPHAVVAREDVESHILIVGDIHGCVTEFRTLVEGVSHSLGFTPTIVCVGDLVNKGPGSGESIAYARRIGAKCVRGNHDEDLLAAIHRVGKFKTNLDAYHHSALNEVSEDDTNWLQECPLSISFPWLDLVVVHAGLIPGVKLQEQSMLDMLWMRDLVEEDGNWVALEESIDDSKPWASVWDGPPFVVFGHDAKRDLQIYPYAVGLDTGCCYGKKLSGLLVNSDDLADRLVVSVRALEMYSAPKISPELALKFTGMASCASMDTVDSSSYKILDDS